jgi:hypothetical protein
MVDGYEKIEFPQIRNDFSDTKIYWRRGGDSVPLISDAEVTKDVNVTADAGGQAGGSVGPENQSEPIAASEEKMEDSTEAKEPVLVPAAEENVEEEESQPMQKSRLIVPLQSTPETRLDAETAQTSSTTTSHSIEVEEWTVIDTEPNTKNPQPKSTKNDVGVKIPDLQALGIVTSKPESQDPKTDTPEVPTQQAKV